MAEKLRKYYRMGYCPNCCSMYNPRRVDEVRKEEDAEGNTYCGKCGFKTGIVIEPRTKKDQRKWLKN